MTDKRFCELNYEEKKEYYRKHSLEYYYKNNDKARESMRNWRLRNKEYILEKQRIRKREHKLEAINYLGGCCSQCQGIFHPSIYEFHHLNPSEKEKDPSKLLSYSWDKITKELDKCILVCANCHRLIHHKENYEE